MISNFVFQIIGNRIFNLENNILNIFQEFLIEGRVLWIIFLGFYQVFPCRTKLAYAFFEDYSW